MYLPINIKVEDRKILIVGGGNVAVHKLKTLLKFVNAHQLYVCADFISDEIKQAGVVCIDSLYSKKQLDDIFLVYACTNDSQVNQQIYDDAHELGILINVADSSSLSDFISPAVYKDGHMSVAVSSQGREVKKSVSWRNKIANYLSD